MTCSIYNYSKLLVSACCLLLMAISVEAMQITDARQFLKDQSQTAFLLQGNIEDGDAERLATLLEPTTGTEVLAFVSSDGGNIKAAFQLSDVIETHGNVKLYVIDRCSSSCASILFPSAKTSELMLGARLGFHSCFLGETREIVPDCNEAVAKMAVARGYPHGAIEMLTFGVAPDEMVWLKYPMLRCWGYYRQEGEDTPIEQRKPCVSGTLRTIVTPLGPYYYETLQATSCKQPSSNSEELLCKDAELSEMMLLAQELYEIVLSYTPEEDQLALEEKLLDWVNDLWSACEAKGELSFIMADRELSRAPVRCMADQLYNRIAEMDDLVAKLSS